MLLMGKMIGAGLSTIALGGGSIGAGIVFGSLILGVSRNPSLRSQLMGLTILGFSLVEAIALFSLMMSFIILFAL